MSDPFLSAAEYYTFTGMTQPADLARVQENIDLASGVIRKFTTQTLSEVVDDVVVFPNTEHDRLILPQRPVTGITAFTVSALPYTAYRFVPNGVIFQTSELNWSSGATVTYNHGYAESTDEYKALKTICLDMVTRSITLNERGSGEAFGAELMESRGWSPAIFLLPNEKMILADLGAVLVG